MAHWLALGTCMNPNTSGYFFSSKLTPSGSTTGSGFTMTSSSLGSCSGSFFPPQPTITAEANVSIASSSTARRRKCFLVFSIMTPFPRLSVSLTSRCGVPTASQYTSGMIPYAACDCNPFSLTSAAQQRIEPPSLRRCHPLGILLHQRLRHVAVALFQIVAHRPL